MPSGATTLGGANAYARKLHSSPPFMSPNPSSQSLFFRKPLSRRGRRRPRVLEADRDRVRVEELLREEGAVPFGLAESVALPVVGEVVASPSGKKGGSVRATIRRGPASSVRRSSTLSWGFLCARFCDRLLERSLFFLRSGVCSSGALSVSRRRAVEIRGRGSVDAAFGAADSACCCLSRRRCASLLTTAACQHSLAVSRSLVGAGDSPLDVESGRDEDSGGDGQRDALQAGRAGVRGVQVDHEQLWLPDRLQKKHGP